MADLDTRDWKAVATLRPQGPHTLVVTGFVAIRAGEWVELEFADATTGFPRTICLDLFVRGAGTEPAEAEARYTDPDFQDQFDRVTVRHYDAEVETVEIARAS